jgi:hypothetical protein
VTFWGGQGAATLDTAAFADDNRVNPSSQGLHMKNALALIVAAALATIAMSFSGPAQARALRPDVPGEIGVRRIGAVGSIPYRCTDGPADNYYHGADYDVPPAIHLGYAYRPYYRYTAYRVVPRTYFCTERY